MGIPIIRFPFIFYIIKGDTLGVLTPKLRNHHQPTGYNSQHLDLVAWEYTLCLRAIAATTLLVKITKKLLCDLLYPFLYLM